jgi:hypothetical protein
MVRIQINKLRWLLGKLRTAPLIVGSEFPCTAKISVVFLEKNKRMNARLPVKQILIAQKLRRWSMICRCGYIEPSFPRPQARKNYWRLFHRYREVAEKIGLHEWSVF